LMGESPVPPACLKVKVSHGFSCAMPSLLQRFGHGDTSKAYEALL